MHRTAMEFGRRFFETYVPSGAGKRIADVGSQDVNGSLRSVAPAGAEYIGLDFVEGKGVDVVITDPYKLPLENGSVDACVTSSCFEHSEFFWLSYLECLRILKPDGLLFLNTPSNGYFHRYPVDCWRFYPDAGMALRNWGRRNGLNPELLESFVGKQEQGVWNDFIAVYVKDKAHESEHRGRISKDFASFTNGRTGTSEQITNFDELPQDLRNPSARLKRAFTNRFLGGFK